MPTIKELLRLRTPAPVVEPTSEELARHEAEVRARQEEYSPLWKASEKVIRGASGFIGGATGLSDFVPGAPALEDKANALGQLLTSGIPTGKALGAGGKALGAGLKVLEAGLPFAAYKAKLPKGYLVHGSPVINEFEKFNYNEVGQSNWKPGMMHAAENPEDAVYDYTKRGHDSLGSGSLPIELEANNVLDLIEPDEQDLLKYILTRDTPTQNKLLPRLRQSKSPKDFIDNIYRNEYEGQVGANAFKYMDPNDLGVAGFDAVRYPIDIESLNAWAWPETTPVKSAISGHDFTPVNKSKYLTKK